MVIFTASLSKRKLLWLLPWAVVLTAGILWALSPGASVTGTEARAFSWPWKERVTSSTASWGWEVDSEPLETYQFLIPDPLPEKYADYNQLQKSQGLDLESCLGKAVTRYTYSVLNYPGRDSGVQVNLYVCEGRPAAGDLVASGSDGFRSGLEYPKDAS